MNDGPTDTENGLRGAPSGYFVVVPQQAQADSISLGAVVRIALRSWKLIFVCGLITAVIAAGVSLLVRPKFRAVAIVSPVEQQSMGAGGALRSQFGGLAALAGIDLGSGGRDKEQALATLKSPGFARDFIQRENLLPEMYADKWDAAAKRWRAGEPAPSIDLAVSQFMNDVRSVSEDPRTGIVTVTAEWYSPELAARWANRMIEVVNERMRTEATGNSERSIEYLNKELAKTAVVELRHAIFRLIEEQVNNAMLANVQREYAFRVIDPAVAPEMRSSPKRTMMVLIAGVLGVFIGIAIVFIRRAIKGSAAEPAKIGS